MGELLSVVLGDFWRAFLLATLAGPLLILVLAAFLPFVTDD